MLGEMLRERGIAFIYLSTICELFFVYSRDIIKLDNLQYSIKSK